MDTHGRYPNAGRESEAASGPERSVGADSGRPVPLALHFGWRPGFDDYPIPLVQHTSVRPAREYPRGDTNWIPRVEVLSAPKPVMRYAPHLVAVGIVAAVVAGGWWWRSDPGDAPPPSATATLSATGQQTQPASAPTATTSSGPGLGGGLTPSTDDPAAATATSDQPAESQPSPEPAEPTPTATASLLDAAIITVTAQAGDTLLDLADEFELNVRTLLWANDVSDPNVFLANGTELVIPNQDGVVHVVAAGDTVESIAAQYGVEPQAIVEAGGVIIDANQTLETGTLVLAVDGVVQDRGRIDAYVVRDGDTLWTIAGYYGLDPATLVWANQLPRAELIYEDQELIIPPGDGALVVTRAGDTVDALATRFEIEPDALRDYAFNGLGANGEPGEGQTLLVPGSFLPALADGPTELTDETVAGEGVVGPATGSFLWPTEGWVTQQFDSSHNGLDIANEAWTPVNATDGGIVIFAGWQPYGLGFTVGIDHGNGFQTWYAHLENEPYVEVGQVIWQGGYLGPMGTSGNAGETHLRFIVIQDGVYQNPLDFLD